MSYSRNKERQYQPPPPPSTPGKGKPGFKSSKDFEKELIGKASKSQVESAGNKDSEPSESSE